MGGIKTKINLEQLEYEVERLNPRKQLFTVLKKALSKIGYWKNKPRGNPKKAYATMRKNREP